MKRWKVRFSEEITYIPNKERMCLTKDQATQVYEEIEKDEPINIQIVSQRIENGKKKQVKCNRKRKMLT